MDQHRGAETCLVGEHAALEALGHGLLDEHADTAAQHGRRGEGELEDGDEHGADLLDVDAEDDERADDVGHGHEGHHDLGHPSDALKTADDDEGADDEQTDTDDEVDDIDLGIRDIAEGCVLEEGGVHIQNDLVDLGHVTDAEGGQNGEAAEEDGQHLGHGAEPLLSVALAQTVAKVVHGTARPLAVLVAAAVVDAQKVFREVGHHTEEGGDPHPEHGTGATRHDGGGHARDVARTDGGGQGGAEGLELGNGFTVGLLGGVAVFLENTGDGVLPPVADVADLEHLGAHGQKDTRTDEQDESGQTPDRAVDGVVDRLDPIEKRFHVCFLHEIKNAAEPSAALKIRMQTQYRPFACSVLLPERFGLILVSLAPSAPI